MLEFWLFRSSEVSLYSVLSSHWPWLLGHGASGVNSFTSKFSRYFSALASYVSHLLSQRMRFTHSPPSLLNSIFSFDEVEAKNKTAASL